jgi:hypothetical protein
MLIISIKEHKTIVSNIQKMKRSVSATQDLKSLPKPNMHNMRRVVSTNSLASDVYQIASVTGSQLDDIACIASAISQSKSGNILDINTFPVGVLDDVKSCLSRPPEPSSIVQIEEKTVPMRHLEVMMRRRRDSRRDSKDVARIH